MPLDEDAREPVALDVDHLVVERVDPIAVDPKPIAAFAPALRHFGDHALDYVDIWLPDNKTQVLAVEAAMNPVHTMWG